MARTTSHRIRRKDACHGVRTQHMEAVRRQCANRYPVRIRFPILVRHPVRTGMFRHGGSRDGSGRTCLLGRHEHDDSIRESAGVGVFARGRACASPRSPFRDVRPRRCHAGGKDGSAHRSVRNEPARILFRPAHRTPIELASCAVRAAAGSAHEPDRHFLGAHRRAASRVHYGLHLGKRRADRGVRHRDGRTVPACVFSGVRHSLLHAVRRILDAGTHLEQEPAARQRLAAGAPSASLVRRVRVGSGRGHSRRRPHLGRHPRRRPAVRSLLRAHARDVRVHYRGRLRVRAAELCRPQRHVLRILAGAGHRHPLPHRRALAYVQDEARARSGRLLSRHARTRFVAVLRPFARGIRIRKPARARAGFRDHRASGRRARGSREHLGCIPERYRPRRGLGGA